jgi:hypothetical protein
MPLGYINLIYSSSIKDTDLDTSAIKVLKDFLLYFNRKIGDRKTVLLINRFKLY